MENLIVASFQDAQEADKGLSKLNELDQSDEIVIYNMVMVRKKEDHVYEYLYDYGPETQSLPADGALIGSLIGAFAGPVGMIIGLMTGATAGAIGEKDTDGFAHDITDTVNDRLKPGEYAIIADVEEDIESMIDGYLAEYGARIFRTSMADTSDQYDLDKSEERKARVANMRKRLQDKTKSLEQKIAAANGQRKEKLKAYNEKVKAKLDKWNKDAASVLA